MVAAPYVYTYIKFDPSILPLFRLIAIAEKMAGKAGGELSRLVAKSITIRGVTHGVHL